MDMYITLALTALVPVLLSISLYALEKFTSFGKLSYAWRQVIIGVAFGCSAIYATEFGVDIGGAVGNARDASPICAALIFGGPAGIIAGAIGGVERWFAVYWGAGYYTRLACSLSTAIIGVGAAAMRKFMFDNKRPGFIIGLAIGIVAEVFHMTMIFFTNMSDSEAAYEVTRICTLPMVSVNAAAVMVALILVALLSKKTKKKAKYKKIAQKVQSRLLIAILIALAATTTFTYLVLKSSVRSDLETEFELNITDVEAEINDEANEKLRRTAWAVAALVDKDTTDDELKDIASEIGVSEINLIDKNGIIFASTNPDYVGFDMGEGAQSAEFLTLLSADGDYVQEYRHTSYDSSVWAKYAAASTNFGMVQTAYNDTKYHNVLNQQVSDLTEHRRIGESGFMLILDSKGNIVSYQQGQDKSALQTNDLMDAMSAEEEIEVFHHDIGGEDTYCMYGITEGYYIFAAEPKAEAMYNMYMELYVNIFMEILIFALLYAIVYFILKIQVVAKIYNINDSLGKITGGNLDEKINVRNSSEFASLSDDINSTVDTLKNYIAEAAARIDKELEFARNIQASALPSTFPPFPEKTEFELFATMATAKEVGGDFYDFYMISETKLGVLIADVSGKGIPAAMFMMRAKTAIKDFVESRMPVEEVFTKANEKLCEGNDAGMFVTAWLGVLDIETGHMVFANAGHNPPCLRHADGSFELFRSRPGLVLAGMEGIKYKRQEVDLEPGSVLFLYTDGITESSNIEHELYGEPRLLDCLNAHHDAAMDELCKAVKESTDEFAGEAPQFDDMTMLALKYFGPKNKAD